MNTLKGKYGTEEEVNLGSETAITAFAGGGQTNATALTKKWNEVTVCATEFDSVKLLAAKIGSKQIIFNNTVNTLSVYPILGEIINGVTNYQFNIAAGESMTFESQKNARWFSYGSSI
jgi:hypothetical protein